MNTVEFQTTIQNGIINLPSDQQSWNGKKIKVILLDESSSDFTGITTKETVPGDDFFICAGIWENREIDQESIRAKAWRTNLQ